MSKLKYGIATGSAIAVFAGVAGLSLPQALAGNPTATSQGPSQGASQAFWITERAKIGFEIQMQECDTLKNSRPEAYEPCMEKARSTRDNLLTQTQGSEDAGQGSQGVGSNQSRQQFSRQEEQGPIDKLTSAVKEKLADWGIGSSDQGREDQPSTGQSQQGGVTQGQHPVEQGLDAGQVMQGQDLAQQSFGASSGQGGQNFGQQGLTRGSAGAQGEHVDRVEYYQELADQQYVTLNQECNTLKNDPNVYEQCRKHAESVRDKIAGMAERG